jgi:DNA-binding transcriptional MerR regulator
MTVEPRFKSTDDHTVTITELADQTGLATSALRFYERKGLLRPVGRRGGVRVYRPEAAEQVALIDILKIAGFTLAEIARFVDTDGRTALGWREQAQEKLTELDARAEALELARTILRHTVACPAPSLEQCSVHQHLLRGHTERLATLVEERRSAGSA